MVNPIPLAVRVRIPRGMDDKSFETCDADVDVSVNIAAFEVECESTDGVDDCTYSRGGMVDDSPLSTPAVVADSNRVDFDVAFLQYQDKAILL